MPKQSGAGWTTLSVDDGAAALQVIKNDVNDLDFATPIAQIDVTGVDKSAHERIAGLADFSITLNGTFDPDANKSHAVLSTITAGLVRSVNLTVGGKSLNNEVLFSDYQIKRGTDAKLSWSAPGALADGTVPTWS